MRRFECQDCGEMTERMWQGGRPLVCLPCAKVRWDIVTTAAHEALEAHLRACRLELLARRAAREAQERRKGVGPV